MSLLRFSALLPLVLCVLVGCDSSQPSDKSATSAVQLAVHVPEALPGDVSRVTVTVSAPDMASRSTDLTFANGAWGGVIDNLPAGSHRTFLVQAFNASSTLRYEGRAEDVTVTVGTTGLVSLTLQEVSAPPPVSNEAPLIDSVVASSITVLPGHGLSLMASAHDPNADDTVSFAWTAPSGSFSAPTQANTTWTAPDSTGAVDLTLTVSDSRGASVTQSLTVEVSYSGSGSSDVRVSFNGTPRVVTLTSSQSFLDVGQQTWLSVSATDPTGDTLSYQWSATCAGDFTGATSSNASFTPSARPGTACNNCQLRVVVKNSHGAQNQGSLALCVGLPITAGPRWSTTGPMVAARQGHQTTLLPNGKVLASGGFDASYAYLASAEVYDPATGTWSPTHNMASGRVSHTATPLPGGKVLVVGGDNNGRSVATAELYDPSTGIWDFTGSMSNLREGHTATLLPNGKVLVAGGFNGLDAVATAELYNPATGTWSPTGAMTHARGSHTATLLPGGKVLVAGGKDNSSIYLAELYDPASGTWSAIPHMAEPRSLHTATLLSNGKVLIAGGFNEIGRPATTELYDPASGTWSANSPMTTPRYNHTATLLPNGQVFVTGGTDLLDLRMTAEVYDPATGLWSRDGSMSRLRTSHAATRLSNGQVLISGGYPVPSSAAPADLYTP